MDMPTNPSIQGRAETAETVCVLMRDLIDHAGHFHPRHWLCRPPWPTMKLLIEEFNGSPRS